MEWKATTMEYERPSLIIVILNPYFCQRVSIEISRYESFTSLGTYTIKIGIPAKNNNEFGLIGPDPTASPDVLNCLGGVELDLGQG